MVNEIDKSINDSERNVVLIELFFLNQDKEIWEILVFHIFHFLMGKRLLFNGLMVNAYF